MSVPTQPTVRDLFAAVIAMTEQMREQAVAADWKRVAELDADRSVLIEHLAAALRSATVDGSEVERLRVLIRKNDEVLVLSRTAHNAISAELRQIARGRRAKRMYTGN